jgi:phage terminase large subunit
MRTTDKMILDYNPSDATSWIYELPEEDTTIIKSTYKDNPFLEQSIIKQIENLQYTDAALWSIYGLGERATSRKNIYSNWTFLDSKPEKFNQYIMGLDFGFNHPTSLVKVWYCEDELFIETVLYESYLTTTNLLERMEELGVDKNVEIMADYARPEIIAEMKQSNFNVHNASKSVKKGIDNVKTFKIFGNSTDKTLQKEYENYMWKKVGDQIIDEPVKLYDDSMDAIRYSVYYIKEQFYNNSPMLFF